VLRVLSVLSAIVLAASFQDPAPLRDAILAAEDARPPTRDGLAPLFRGLASSDTIAQRLAVRGLGRQERAEFVSDIVPLLAATTATVRAEAANALGQAVVRDDEGAAREALERRLGLEDDPFVRGVVLRTLGRLPNPSEDERRRTERLLVQATHGRDGDASPATLEGAAHGLFFLYRRTAAHTPPSVDAIERLVELTAPHHPPLVRRLGMAALVATGRTDSGALLDALRDPEREVRRLAVLAAATQADLPGRERVVRRAWGDPDPAVRYEAIRAFSRRMLPTEGCAPLLPLLHDPAVAVRLQVIELLGQCGPAAAPILARIAAAGFPANAWHEPARALVALARVAPAMADSLLPTAAGHPLWWVRLYAANAAAEAGNVPALEQLAADSHPNVREAALRQLARRHPPRAAAHGRAALALDDYQLLLTAARILDSAQLFPPPERNRVVGSLLRTLDRVTRQRRETSRDTRLALLGAIATLADESRAPLLRPYLADFDPLVAARASEILTRWTGAPHPPRPRPLPRAPVPSWRELAALDSTRAVIHLREGGRLVLRLYPFDAPTNVARFARLARAGWFDGLTFHRVVPNFVVQGGSPGANEYMGDGPYTRDELGLRSNLRGTVGLSTRGRDTGDGQLYINLVDNLRLDHEYTVWAEVVDGLDLLDTLREGAVIARVELQPL
jgi:cyclophilin family peptidyl-prolyl cis-trans isomerase/HEAT repeat protein